MIILSVPNHPKETFVPDKIGRAEAEIWAVDLVSRFLETDENTRAISLLAKANGDPRLSLSEAFVEIDASLDKGGFTSTDLRLAHRLWLEEGLIAWERLVKLMSDEMWVDQPNIFSSWRTLGPLVRYMEASIFDRFLTPEHIDKAAYNSLHNRWLRINQKIWQKQKDEARRAALIDLILIRTHCQEPNRADRQENVCRTLLERYGIDPDTVAELKKK